MKNKSLGLVLIIDDDKDICDLLAYLLQRAGYQTQQGYDGVTAMALLTKVEPDVLLLDSIIPEPNGLAVLAKVRVMYPQLPVIIITGTAGILSAVCAIKAGAWDYMPKPFDNNRVLELVNRAVQTRANKKDRPVKSDLTVSAVVTELMGTSAETKKIIADIERVAHTNFSVIIQGETGAGKELVAKNIHLASRRFKGIFIPIDCGAISEALIENELFGHEKGSFTGADNRSMGKFEAANGGTLFLDEIANMSLSAQAKLLRVLQERVVCRIGSSKPIPIDVRIIAATNENLLDAVVRGDFREDLYYRLNEYVIYIQPLRERPEDIIFLAQRFMKEVCLELSIDVITFSIDAKKVLLSHLWLGNVRELRSVIRRVALVAQKEVSDVDLKFLMLRVTLPYTRVAPSVLIQKSVTDFSCLTCVGSSNYKNLSDYDGLSLKEITRMTTQKMDAIIIQNMLKETRNNKAEAARRLGMDYKSLCSKLKKILNSEVKG